MAGEGRGRVAMIVDEAELKSQTFGDAELLREVVSLFLLETPALLAAMEAASGQARADIAHRLKGSALALGARPLAEAAALIEQSPDDGGAIREVRFLADETLAALRRIAGIAV